VASVLKLHHQPARNAHRYEPTKEHSCQNLDIARSDPRARERSAKKAFVSTE